MLLHPAGITWDGVKSLPRLLRSKYRHWHPIPSWKALQAPSITRAILGWCVHFLSSLLQSHKMADSFRRSGCLVFETRISFGCCQRLSFSSGSRLQPFQTSQACSAPRYRTCFFETDNLRKVMSSFSTQPYRGIGTISQLPKYFISRMQRFSLHTG